MFYRSWLIVVVLALPTMSAQKVKVKSEGVFIYSGETTPEKIAVLSESEEVYLLQQGATRSKIKASGGFVGWTPNSDLLFVVEQKGSRFDLKEMEIHGWLDNPTAIYILDETNFGSEGLLLTRDFHHEIFEFIDREVIERRNHEN